MHSGAVERELVLRGKICAKGPWTGRLAEGRAVAAVQRGGGKDVEKDVPEDMESRREIRGPAEERR